MEYQETVKEHQINPMNTKSYSGTPSFMKYQEAFIQYKEAFYTRRLVGYTKNLSCNTKKPKWNTQELVRNTKKLYRIPWSFIEQHEVLRNTKELHVYQVADQKYQKGLWNTRKLWRTTLVNSCPDSAKQKTSQDPPKWRPAHMYFWRILEAPFSVPNNVICCKKTHSKIYAQK